MFTGIIEAVGNVSRIDDQGTNKHFRIESEISNQLRVDQSLSHNGVCLTVTSVTPEGAGSHFTVDVSNETLSKTALAAWQPGEKRI